MSCGTPVARCALQRRSMGQVPADGEGRSLLQGGSKARAHRWAMPRRELWLSTVFPEACWCRGVTGVVAPHGLRSKRATRIHTVTTTQTTHHKLVWGEKGRQPTQRQTQRHTDGQTEAHAHQDLLLTRPHTTRAHRHTDTLMHTTLMPITSSALMQVPAASVTTSSLPPPQPSVERSHDGQ